MAFSPLLNVPLIIICVKDVKLEDKAKGIKNALKSLYVSLFFFEVLIVPPSIFRYSKDSLLLNLFQGSFLF
ncbi:hypothetical protein J8TS2_31980 [Lederbergia ruris]|uniref:Uncharacterized protein n=1 Tax=Lederbergia ruris TaxID=217495 RepID=A0ABQ4KLR6_9BACI|nr:hypothetical protein J8TS2_31980 [Lederbergia ruris]